MTDAPEHIWAVIEPDDISAQILGDVYAQQTPEGMVGAPVKYTRDDLPPKVKPLVWVPSVNGQNDLRCHTQFGMYCVYEIDGGYAATLRLINDDHQLEDVRIGWAESRRLVLEDCQNDCTSRVLSCLVGGE